MSRAGALCELAALAREERAQARDRENEERYGLKAGLEPNRVNLPRGHRFTDSFWRLWPERCVHD